MENTRRGDTDIEGGGRKRQNNSKDAGKFIRNNSINDLPKNTNKSVYTHT